MLLCSLTCPVYAVLYCKSYCFYFGLYSMFCARKTRFTCGFNLVRKTLTINLPLLNTRSDSTLVAGMQRYFLAITARREKYMQLFPPQKWITICLYAITHLFFCPCLQGYYWDCFLIENI